MSLAEDVERYIAFKRALGLKFKSQGLVLRRFVEFSRERGDSPYGSLAPLPRR